MTPGFSTIEDALRYATARLTDAGLASPRQEARQLVAAALSIDSLALYSASDRAYDPALQARLIQFIDKRTAGEPVSRIRGEREFWSLPIGLSDDVLDPQAGNRIAGRGRAGPFRPETGERAADPHSGYRHRQRLSFAGAIERTAERRRHRYRPQPRRASNRGDQRTGARSGESGTVALRFLGLPSFVAVRPGGL